MDSEIRSHEKYYEFKFAGDADVKGFKGLFDNPLYHKKSPFCTLFLIDMTELNALPLTLNDLLYLKRLSMKLKFSLKQSRFALVTSRNHEYGIARMWMSLIEEDLDIAIATFRSREKATSWLINTN